MQKTGIIFAAIALGSTAIWLITSQKNSSIALTEEWTVIDVTDAQTMILRQTDGNQMQVRLCRIDASELGNKAKDKLRSLLGLPFAVASLKEKASLVAINDSQVMVIPAGEDEQGQNNSQFATRNSQLF
ncbi:MAG: hypothetical protein RMX96_33645 [Nostoc sp. ChiSLP02]|nr:hypothetical protein [Nostoc sp. DedSLP05]MDZ8101539.1 hypothetical protein [Nostoc sp. DedSLP01]MDZ8189768.1 hypothetical protein [Nostoc sp. ChiSLP02]